MAKIFITGTDTDVGKTIVTAGLLRILRERGVDVVSMKPVQTGAEEVDGRMTAPDLTLHWQIASLEASEKERDLMGPYLYKPACSPHLAGRMAGEYPDTAHIVDCANRLDDAHDALLIEGAGGAMAPIDESHTMVDLMVALACPVLVVAHRGLGTINHTLLTIEALRRAKLDILGVVFNETQNVEPDFIKQDNPASVAQFGKVEVLGDIDYLEDLSHEDSWARFEAGLTGLNRILESIQ